MHRFTLATALALVVLALPAVSQTNKAETQAADATIQQAQAVLTAAEQAGAAQYATSLYDEAQFRVRFAQDNW